MKLRELIPVFSIQNREKPRQITVFNIRGALPKNPDISNSPHAGLCSRIWKVNRNGTPHYRIAEF